MALQATGRAAIDTAVSARKDFRHGNVRGAWYPSWAAVPRGQFDGTYDTGRVSVGMVYVVFSYQTPIAMFSPISGWTMPNVRYSVTTTNHQATVRMALHGQDVSA